MSLTAYGDVIEVPSGTFQPEAFINPALRQAGSLTSGIFEKNVAATTSPYTLTRTDEMSIAESQAPYFRYHGTRSVVLTVIHDPTATPRLFVVFNDATTKDLTVKVTSGGIGPVVTSGKARLLYHNGVDVFALGGEFTPAITEAWASWTPTWTNLTLGNGTVVARFIQIGKIVLCRLSLVFGSTTSVSGDINFSLPITRATYGGNSAVLGQARAIDADAAVGYIGSIISTSTTAGLVRFYDSSGTYLVQSALASSTVPFTWAINDEIIAQFFYEAA